MRPASSSRSAGRACALLSPRVQLHDPPLRHRVHRPPPPAQPSRRPRKDASCLLRVRWRSRLPQFLQPCARSAAARLCSLLLEFPTLHSRHASRGVPCASRAIQHHCLRCLVSSSLYMCPHTSINVSAYLYICVPMSCNTTPLPQVPRYMCPNTIMCALMPLYMSPRTSINESSNPFICGIRVMYLRCGGIRVMAVSGVSICTVVLVKQVNSIHVPQLL